MSFWDTITTLIGWDATKYQYFYIPTEQVENPAPSIGTVVESGKHYFQVFLSEMYLKKHREWFKTWYPVVHTQIELQFGTQIVELPHVAGPLQLEGVKETTLENVVQLNHALTPLLPFNGGLVKLVSVLLAMEGKNTLQSFVKVMGDFSKLLIVPEVSAALNLALPLANGVQDLLSGTNREIDLGLHQSFTGAGGGGANVLRSGYYVVLKAEAGQYQSNLFQIRNDRLFYGPTATSKQPLTGVTYMLFRVDARTERDDWASLSTIKKAFLEALKALEGGNPEGAKTLLRKALFQVRASDDLTKADQNRVVSTLTEEFKAAQNQGLGLISFAADPFLTAINNATDVDVNSALMNEPDIDDLLNF